MDKEQFWQIIDDARTSAGTWNEMCEPLVETLSKLEIEDIMLWDKIFSEYMMHSYTTGLLATDAIMYNGCSDDGFEYYRNWLIAQGKEVYMKALADPDSMPDLEAVRALALEVTASEFVPIEGYKNGVRFEEIMFAAHDAIELKYDLAQSKWDFTLIDRFRNTPLTAEVSAEILRDIPGHAKATAIKGGESLEWVHNSDALKQLLPRVYSAFRSEEMSPQERDSPVMKLPEKESLAQKLARGKQAAAQNKSEPKSPGEHGL